MILSPIILTSMLIQLKAQKVKVWYEEVEATVTAYDYQEFSGKDSTGKRPIVQRTVACPRRIRLGSRISGIFGQRVCTDRTAKRFDGRFDLFVGTKKEAIVWGKRKEKVLIELQ